MKKRREKVSTQSSTEVLKHNGGGEINNYKA